MAYNLRIILSIYLSAAMINVYGISDKKYQRMIMKADRFYENFAYSKAVELYEKAIALKEEESILDMQAALKIADSYRLMNQPISAEKWYGRVTKEDLMSDQDLMNYAQVLLKNGKDAQARKIVASISAPDVANIERLKSANDVSKFYTDSLAYFVENLNINSMEADFSPTYYEDGLVFVSNRPNKRLNQSTYYWDDTYFLDLYYSNNDGGIESEPEAMTKRINSIFHEGPAVFIENDSKIIFTRNNFNLGESATSSDGIVKMKLFMAEKMNNGKWSKPVELPFNSNEYTTSSPTFSADEKTMYFHSDMPGSLGKSDIFKVSYIDGKWGSPENMGPEVNTAEEEMFPFIADDNTLYFASTGLPGIGGLDIYKINLDDPSSRVTNMGFPINTYRDDFGLIMEGKTGYLSSNRDGGRGSDDIYRFTIYTYEINVRLIDADTKESLTGSISVFDKNNEELLAGSTSAESVAFISFRGKTLNLLGVSEGYQQNEFEFNTANIDLNTESYTIDIPLMPKSIPTDIIWVHNHGQEDQVLDLRDQIAFYSGTLDELKSDYAKTYHVLRELYEVSAIYYDFDKSSIRSDASEGLDGLIEVLNTYQDLNVQLTAHTDNRGSNSYNERLSVRRVNAAKDYLLKGGIAENRIRVDYKGELKPVEQCDTCSEASHQLNRRTEIYLIK